MVAQKTFGRRTNIPRPGGHSPAPRAAPRPSPVPQLLSIQPAVDQELQAWKRARAFRIPWRQLSLMASLCFGIASFVLPDSVNENVQWVLYALMAASFLAGITARRSGSRRVQ